MRLLKWEVTQRCNLRCAHCLVGKELTNSSNDLLTTGRALSVIDDAASLGVKHLSLLGGEPLLRRDLPKLVQHATEHRIRVSIVTNGLLLSPSLLRNLRHAGLCELTVSIDGATTKGYDAVRGTGNFARLMDVLRAIKSQLVSTDGSFKFCVNTVVHKLNSDVESLSSFAQLASEFGVALWRLLPLQTEDLATTRYRSTTRALSATEYLEFASVLSSSRGHFPPATTIDVQFLGPLAWAYLSLRGSVLPFPLLCCDAASDMLFVQADGEIAGCDRVRQLPSSRKVFGHSTLQGREVSLRQFLLSTSNSRLYSHVKGFAQQCSYTPCRQCQYLRDGFCEPCPLYALEHIAAPYESCSKAASLLKEMGRPIDRDLPRPPRSPRRCAIPEECMTGRSLPANTTPVPSEDVVFGMCEGKGYLFGVSTNRHLVLGELPLYVYLLIDGQRTLRQITELVAGFTDHKSIADEITADIIARLLEADGIVLEPAICTTEQCLAAAD